MHNNFSDLLVRLLFEAVCYPVRHRHPIIVVGYVLALFAGIVFVSYGITRLIPDSPY